MKNRSIRLYELLLDAPNRTMCAFDLWPLLHTAPMRAAHELKKSGANLETVDTHRHNGANYAVYRLGKTAVEELREMNLIHPISELNQPKQTQLTI